MTVPRKTTRSIDFSDIPEASVDQLGGLRRLAMRRGTPSPSASSPSESEKVRACVRTKLQSSERGTRKASSVDWRTRKGGPHHACATGVR